MQRVLVGRDQLILHLSFFLGSLVRRHFWSFLSSPCLLSTGTFFWILGFISPDT
ncbi:hypothetical protein BDZ97DRAFT_1796472, partial [Flammula alnicola]